MPLINDSTIILSNFQNAERQEPQVASSSNQSSSGLHDRVTDNDDDDNVIDFRCWSSDEDDELDFGPNNVDSDEDHEFDNSDDNNDTTERDEYKDRFCTYVEEYKNRYRYNSQVLLKSFKYVTDEEISSNLENLERRLSLMLVDSEFSNFSALDPTLDRLFSNQAVKFLREKGHVIAPRGTISINPPKKKSKTVPSLYIDKSVDLDDFIDDGGDLEHGDNEVNQTINPGVVAVGGRLVLTDEEEKMIREIKMNILKNDFNKIKDYHKRVLNGTLSHMVTLKSGLCYYFRSNEYQQRSKKSGRERNKTRRELMEAENEREREIDQAEVEQRQSDFVSVTTIDGSKLKVPEYAMEHQNECISFAMKRIKNKKSLIIGMF